MANIQLSIPEHFQPALAALLTSFDYAQDSGTETWQFAIELSELLANGATLPDLRWLILRKFAEHAKETTISGDPARSFRPLVSTNFPNEACVVLTTAGATAIRSLLRDTTAFRNSQLTSVAGRIGGDEIQDDESRESLHGQSPDNAMSGVRDSRRPGRGVGSQPASSIVEQQRGAGFQPAATSSLVPHYDAMLHELRLGDEIVKCFTRPAPAQELILKVFEEEGWPPAIDDPLTSANQDPKRHLHYTIRNLNRGQVPLRIRFYINGHGETIRWEVVPHKRAISARPARQRR